MEIYIKRFRQGKESTVAKLYVNTLLIGYILEDRDRGLSSTDSLESIQAQKIAKRTAIPTGRYLLLMTKSKRFGRVTPELMAVPGYGGIRIHTGNYIGDTEGCPLPGLTFNQDKNGYLVVWESKKAMIKLQAHIDEAIRSGDPVYCNISRDY